MRTLRRNQSEFWVAGKLQNVKKFSDEGKYLGVEYTRPDPEKCRGFVTAGTGNIYHNPFGSLPDIQRMILVAEGEVEVGQVVWIDRTTNEDPEYYVERVARSLNNEWIALKTWNHTYEN